MSLHIRHLGLIAVLFAFCLLVVGCGGSKVTKENAGKIKEGMSVKEVKDILGDPTETKDEEMMGMKMTVSTWKSGNDSVTVGFIEEKVGKGEGGAAVKHTFK